MSEEDKGLSEFLAMYPEGHPDLDIDRIYGELSKRFINSRFVEDWTKKITEATQPRGTWEVLKALDDVLGEGINSGDLSAIMSVFAIFDAVDLPLDLKVHLCPASRRNLILARVLENHGRNDLADKFIFGMADNPESPKEVN